MSLILCGDCGCGREAWTVSGLGSQGHFKGEWDIGIDIWPSVVNGHLTLSSLVPSIKLVTAGTSFMLIEELLFFFL